MREREGRGEETRERLTVRFFNFAEGRAEGRFAISILPLVILTLATLHVWGQLCRRSGLICNVITTSDPRWRAIVTDPRVDMISFTGSTAVGERITQQGVPALKRVF